MNTSDSDAESNSLNWAQLRTDALESISIQTLSEEIELPVLPKAVTEFVVESSDPDCDFARLAQIIEIDAGLTCELLRYVNSARYGLMFPIRNVPQALAQLGLTTSRTYLMAAGAKSATRAQQSRLLNHRHFWNESLRRGLFSRIMATHLKLDGSLCFLGGLLQDFMLPVLTNRYDADYIQFMETDGREGRDLCDWGNEHFGCDHTRPAVAVARGWRFPDDLLCALFYHHELLTTLHRPEAEFLNLFPVTSAALLPDQLSPT
jgi:HD-like signal output (HDOD) protein